MPSQTGSIDLTAQVSANNNAKDYSDNVVDNLEIGGRNLLAFSDRKGTSNNTYNGLTISFGDDGWITCSGTLTSSTAGIFLLWGTSNASAGIYDGVDHYTLTIEDDGVLSDGKLGIQIYGRQNSTNKYHIEYEAGSYTYADLTDFVSRVCIYFAANSNGLVVNGRIRLKLEKGDKATDWTPAPEDVDASISSAAQTATNYITADANGISIHMAGNSTTYQRQTSDSTTFYVGGKKRSAVGADGLKVYVGATETEMASFGISTRIGKAYVEGATDNESHMDLDYHSMRMVDKDGNEFFKIEDLRDTNGVATITDTFFSDGYSRSYNLSALAENTSYTVNVSDSSGGTPTKTLQYVEFETPPNEGSIITVVYSLTSAIAKSYTFGIRGIGNIGPMSVAEGSGTIASGMYSHAEGLYSISSSWASHAEGNACDATGPHSHAEGAGTQASGNWSHSEGYETEATNAGSHAEGQYAVSNAPASHAEGYHTLSSYGYGSILYGSHAEGYYSQALDAGAHAEGFYTVASGQASHAEGSYCTASAAHTHAQNYKTVAGYGYQTTIGKYNDNKSNTALEIGNGTSDNNRSNAATIDWNGNYIGQAMAGIIQMFAGATPPTGWLVCDGSAISRTTYATLFAAIGTTWGAGDGSTTFNVPDLRGRMPMGAGTGSGLTARTLGNNLGAETHNHSGNSGEVTLSAAQSGLPAHTHEFTQPTIRVKYAGVGASGSVNRPASSGTNYSTSIASASGGAVGAVTGGAKNASSAHKHTISSDANIPPSAVVNFIICTGKTS